MAKIICWRSGEVEIVSRAPEGSATLMTGPRSRLEKLLIAHARHGYDGKTLLVPGLPEAGDEDAAVRAIQLFQLRLVKAKLTARRPRS